MTKRTLWLGASSLYSILVAIGPTLLGEAGLDAACGSGGSQHASCDFGWTFADDACFKLFGDDAPLSWADAEEACQEMGSQTHLASVTSAEQQRTVEHLAGGADLAWIGLNDMAEEGSFVWSNDEPLEYTNWAQNEGPDGASGAVTTVRRSDWQWSDGAPSTTKFPYICAKKATPTVASGGEMNGCTDGRWVMGTPYKQPHSLGTLAPTVVYGMYEAKVYDEIKPTKIALNRTVTTPAECAALVHRDHRNATAAEYSNVGEEWCFAVFEA